MLYPPPVPRSQVGREVVENALLDIVDRIGEGCADESVGVVTIDFKFGKLQCENKSIEFIFGAGPPSTASKSKPPTTAGSSRGGARPPSVGAGKLGDSLGLAGASLGRRTQPDAPLQRPHRPHIKAAVKVSASDMLASHDRQLEEKRHALEVQREEEASQHYDSLQRLRGEMVVEYSQREERRAHNAALAEQQKQQKAEKLKRDKEAREVVGIDHWPFRTEEQVQAQVDATNVKQKQLLDAQLLERKEKRAFIERQLAKQTAKAVEVNVERNDDEERQRAHAMASSQQSVSKTLDQAYSRYEDYLHKRKQVESDSNSYVREQRYLSEQVELLKQEEQRRRMEEMKTYLEMQKREKLAKDAANKLDERTDETAGGVTPTLPTGIEPDPEEEFYVKQALRRALDGQVEHKARAKEAAVQQDKAQQQHVLNCVALEMRQARFRELSQRRDQADMLKSTWAKQDQLKKLELEIEKGL